MGVLLQSGGGPPCLQGCRRLRNGYDEVCSLTMQCEEVNKIYRKVILGEVQWQITNVAEHLIEELDKHFPHQDVMCALGIR